MKRGRSSTQRIRSKVMFPEQATVLSIRASWRTVSVQDDPRCDYCDRALTTQTATVDHIVPLSLRVAGAVDKPENYALACLPCNHLKDNRTPEQAGMPLLRRRGAPIVVVKGWGVRDARDNQAPCQASEASDRQTP